MVVKLCFPFVQKLLTLTNQETQNQEQEEKKTKESLVALNLLSVVFKNMKPVEKGSEEEPHVLTGVFTELYPLIDSLLQKYHNRLEYVEKICKVVKIVMRCLKKQFSRFCE